MSYFNVNFIVVRRYNYTENYNNKNIFKQSLAEDHLLSPSLLKKTCLAPTDIHQHVNSANNFEHLFLLSGCKICVLGRANPPPREIPKGYKDSTHFLPYFTVYFLDELGVLRQTKLFDEFCDLNDSNLKPKTDLNNLHFMNLGEEASSIRVRVANRQVPFDIDDDIVIMPNFVTRKNNSLLVMPLSKLEKIMGLS
jgi:hypothetical protein